MKPIFPLLISLFFLSGALYAEEDPLAAGPYQYNPYYDFPCNKDISNSYMPAENQTFGKFLSGNLRNSFAIELSALYWKASRDDRAYALTFFEVGDTESFTLHVVKPKANIGGRIRAKYEDSCFGCSFADVEYTYFKSHSQDATFAPALVDPFGFFLNNVTDLSLRVTDFYQRARARLGWNVFNACRGSLYGIAGASWIYLSEKEQMNATVSDGPPGPAPFLTQKSTFTGGALEAGMGGIFHFFDCFGIKTEFNGVAAIGNRHHQLSLGTNIGSAGDFVFLSTLYPKVTHLIPGFDLCSEIFLTGTFFCPITIALGYEFHYFFNPILLTKDINFDGTLKALVKDNYNLGFGGAYLSLKINY